MENKMGLCFSFREMYFNMAVNDFPNVFCKVDSTVSAKGVLSLCFFHYKVVTRLQSGTYVGTWHGCPLSLLIMSHVWKCPGFFSFSPVGQRLRFSGFVTSQAILLCDPCWLVTCGSVWGTWPDVELQDCQTGHMVSDWSPKGPFQLTFLVGQPKHSQGSVLTNK